MSDSGSETMPGESIGQEIFPRFKGFIANYRQRRPLMFRNSNLELPWSRAGYLFVDFSADYIIGSLRLSDENRESTVIGASACV